MPAFKGIQGGGGGGGGPSQGHSLPHDYGGDFSSDPFVQNLFVMRHGEQLDGADSSDPPLTEQGKLQAWRVGRRLRMEDWNITRVAMSPSLRCVQTAAEVIAGLCMLPSSIDRRGGGGGGESPDAPKIKAWVEFGLAETINVQSTKRAPQERDSSPAGLAAWTLELSALIPRGTVCDMSLQQSRQQKLPVRRESATEARYRLTSTFQGIANSFSGENVLCITHGEGVKQSVTLMWPRVVVYGVTYCAFTHAQRPNYKHGDGANLVTGDWELLTESGPDSGLFFGPSP